MTRFLRGVALAMVLAVLPACSTFLGQAVSGSETLAPQTVRERLVAAEADYEAVVTTIRDLALQGLIVGDTATAAAQAITAARSALDLWHLDPDNLDRMTLTIAALTQLQVIVRTAKGTQP